MNSVSICIHNIDLKKLILLISIIIVWGCERDDICAETTPTTPNLQIAFFDINTPDSPKAVNGLSVRAEGIEDFVTFNSDIDAASLPLSFNAEGLVTSTRFLMIKDQELDLDEDEDTNSNTDIIEISYTPEFLYVSRACGYKSVFRNIQITLIDDGDNWILSSDINIQDIENEDETHISIFH